MAIVGEANCVAYAYANSYSGSGDWIDEMGNGHDAAPQAGVAVVDSGSNDYWDLDGASDRLIVPDNAALDFNGTSFTIGLACNSDDWGHDVGNDVRLIDKRAVQGYSITIDDSNSDKVTAQAADDQFDNDVWGTTLNTSQIYSIIMRIDVASTGEIEIFVDGTGTGSPQALPGDRDWTNAQDLGIGGFVAGGGEFDGRIYSWALLNRALSDAEVSTLSDELKNQTDPNPSGLSGYWGLRVASWFLAGTSGLWLPDTASDLLDMV